MSSYDSFLMGGEASSFIHSQLAKHFDFQGHSDSLPLCFFASSTTSVTGCLPLECRTCKASQSNVDIWSLNITSLVHWYRPGGLISDCTPPFKKFPACDYKTFSHSWDNIRPATGHPKWIQCVFPDTGVTFHPYNNAFIKIHDWSYTSLEPTEDQWTTFGWPSPTYTALLSH